MRCGVIFPGQRPSPDGPHQIPQNKSRSGDWRSRGIAAGLAIRHDHGSASMSDAFQRELAFLGLDSSPSFVREPEGNGCAERFIRTLKENLLWVRSFATVAELADALREFRRRYNDQWLIERHGFRTPSQVRAELTGGARPVA